MALTNFNKLYEISSIPSSKNMYIESVKEEPAQQRNLEDPQAGFLDKEMDTFINLTKQFVPKTINFLSDIEGSLQPQK
jgi:hypothetical protein